MVLAPGGIVSAASLVAVGVVLMLIVPNVLPELNRQEKLNAALDSVSQFQLTDPVNTGLFKASARTGDTRPDDEALVYGVAITSKFDRTLAHKNAVSQAAKRLEESGYFSKNSQRVYHGVILFKGLGLLSSEVKDRFQEELRALQEKNSGFRVSHLLTSSVTGTYFAFSAMAEMGTLEGWKREHSHDFEQAVQFVLKQQDTKYGGFRNDRGGEPSLEASAYAHRILLHSDTKDATYLNDALGRFISTTQTSDGGFGNLAVIEGRNATSSLMHTTMAMHLVSALQKLSVSSDVDMFSGISYLRACLGDKGVTATPAALGAVSLDLRSTLHLLEFTSEHPTVNLGTPRWIEWSLRSVGALLALLGLCSAVDLTYSVSWTRGAKAFIVCAVFLLLGAAAFEWCTKFVTAIYLGFSFFLVVQYFERADSEEWGTRDSTQCTYWLLVAASSSSAGHLAFCYLLLHFAEGAFRSSAAYLALLAIDGLAIFLSSYICGILMDDRRKMAHGWNLFTSAAYMSWITSTLAQYSFLYVRGEWAFVTAWATVRGLYPVVAAFIPLLSLVVCCYSAGFACHLLIGNTGSGKHT
mmetsp:Transcript_12375/g.28546  ORF Transcript_12375/g.28546 Transcript_12375/m.28546 type:complete len:581 (-) Transcript_12375:119-1861(-)